MADDAPRLMVAAAIGRATSGRRYGGGRTLDAHD
jgi:hypothetical protein